jgi:hypothetical protein
MKKYLLLGAPLLAVALMGLGCNPFASVTQKVTDTAVEQAIKAKTGIDVNVNGSANLSSDFPSDVPRYPGAVYVSSLVQATVAIANFTTTDDPKTVSDWFDAQLKAEGFTQDENVVMNGTIRIYHKGNVTMNVTAMSKGDGTPTSVSIQRAEQSR